MRRVGFMAVAGKRALPSKGSARCSLLGEAERLAVGQSLRKVPKLLVQPDIVVQARDRAGAREAFPIRTAGCGIAPHFSTEASDVCFAGEQQEAMRSRRE